jgi:hypothetical protein
LLAAVSCDAQARLSAAVTQLSKSAPVAD